MTPIRFLVKTIAAAKTGSYNIREPCGLDFRTESTQTEWQIDASQV